MKRATVLLLALLLVPAAQADAKFTSARVCGPFHCREITPASGQSLATTLAYRNFFTPAHQLREQPEP